MCKDIIGNDHGTEAWYREKRKEKNKLYASMMEDSSIFKKLKKKNNM
jgi:hypothetical protein